MTSLKIEETKPAAEGFQDAHGKVFQDAHGIVRFKVGNRKLALRQPSLSKRLRLLSWLGKDSENPMVLEYSLVAASLVELDGEPVTPPHNRATLDLLLDRAEQEVMQRAIAMYRIVYAGAEVTPDELKN